MLPTVTLAPWQPVSVIVSVSESVAGGDEPPMGVIEATFVACRTTAATKYRRHKGSKCSVDVM
jgi:hypothetical protein